MAGPLPEIHEFARPVQGSGLFVLIAGILLGSVGTLFWVGLVWLVSRSL